MFFDFFYNGNLYVWNFYEYLLVKKFYYYCVMILINMSVWVYVEMCGIV